MVAEFRGPMEVAIVTDTPVAKLWFHTFAVFLHLNLYSNETNSINKKDQLFSQKKKKENAMITI